ncbi:hypothetical protein LINPERPRIM_LOCUS33750 [Linum perenne]
MQYARTFFLDTVGVDIKSFKWKVVAAPVQQDINSCGLYTLRFMELYIGRFTAEHKHQFDDTTFMDTDRLRYMSRLLLSEANELRGEVLVAATSLEGLGNGKKGN